MHCEQRLLPLNGTLTTQSARFEGYQLANETILHSLDATPLPTSLASCSPPPSIVPSTVAPGLNNNNNYDEYLQLRWHNWHLVSRRQQLIPHQQGMLFVDGPNGHLYRIDNAQDGQQQMVIISMFTVQMFTTYTFIYK
jgi:hypothetical protein